MDYQIFQTLFYFLLTIGVLVVAHEFGHFIVAKWCGMRVEEFAVGFGPKWIVLARRNGTEYTIRPIPLGGFVRIAGMESHDDPNPPPGTFFSRPIWQRNAVVLAGPFMSLLLGYVIFSIMGMTVGLDIGKPLNRVAHVIPGSEAERMGLKTGDVIVEINKEPIRDGEHMMKVIHNSPGKRLFVRVERNGRSVLLSGVPKEYEVEEVKDGKKVVKKVGRLGFYPSFETKRLSPWESLAAGTRITVNMIRAIPEHLFTEKVKDSVGGPVAIVQMTHTAAKEGLHRVLSFMAALSISLGILNLFPIPILDGGHLVLYFIEWLRGGRRLTAKQQMAVQMVGLVILLSILVLVTANDITRLIAGRLPQ
ncbi:MAG: RIP metalloprotease RseP [Armatimonadetes bacterium]|nr:RIP metalloprotease RseP [Armatimonadota bacterium]